MKKTTSFEKLDLHADSPWGDMTEAPKTTRDQNNNCKHDHTLKSMAFGMLVGNQSKTEDLAKFELFYLLHKYNKFQTNLYI